MKKIGVWIFAVLFLTGCVDADRELERGMHLRSRLLKASSSSFHTEITADYGDKIHTFAMDCAFDGDGNMTFSVSAPESISGITGTMGEDGGELTFDDTALHFELLADDLITPVSAPWILMKTLRSGFLCCTCQEDDLLRLTIDDSYEDEELVLDIWLDGQDLPVKADICYDGRRILSLTVTSFGIA